MTRKVVACPVKQNEIDPNTHMQKASIAPICVDSLTLVKTPMIVNRLPTVTNTAHGNRSITNLLANGECATSGLKPPATPTRPNISDENRNR